MTPEQKGRAGRAVRDRIDELGTTVPAVARRAGVDAKTLRGLIAGSTWPTTQTRLRLSEALQWPDDEIQRRAFFSGDPTTALRSFRSIELLAELARRATAYEMTQKRLREET